MAGVEAALKRYRSLTPLLIKVEEVVAGTASGTSPALAGYYAYWEQVRMVCICG